MIYLNSPYTRVHSSRLKKYVSASQVNTGSETIADAEFIEACWWQEKRSFRDRRQRVMKPLLDLRRTRDRREDSTAPSISIIV